MSLEDIADHFREENLPSLLDSDIISDMVDSFKSLHKQGMIVCGGKKPPSCETTDVLSESYNPQTSCHCAGLYPIPNDIDVKELLKSHTCQTVRNTLDAMDNLAQRPDEQLSGLYTIDKLRLAVHELILASADEQLSLDTCQGPGTIGNIPEIQAPDRRPHPINDMSKIMHRELYPSAEDIKICADARHYFTIACAANICDHGIARAIADSGNDILIGDYAGALDDVTLKVLQRTGAAGIAFLKVCNMAGRVTDWEFDNLVASIIQNRVLMTYQDHARPRLPKGIWGSRMTGLVVQRHIDLGLWHAIMPAAIATKSELDEAQFEHLVKASTLINDLADFRSDAFRNTRENPVLRGTRGSVCEYLDGLILDCLRLVTAAIKTSELGALVVMACCNWVVMGSQHKLYEVVSSVRTVQRYSLCDYRSEVEVGYYENLQRELEKYGTLGSVGPSVFKKRAAMDAMYVLARESEDTHKAWLADVTRSFLNPATLRKVIDVVHFKWTGNLGDAVYCP